MFNITGASFTSQDGVVKRQKDALRFCAKGERLSDKRYTFAADVSFELEEYFVLEYSCEAVRRQLSRRLPFVFAVTEDGGIPLVVLDDITIDAKRHSVIVRTQPAHCIGLKLWFAIDRRGAASFTVYNMYTCHSHELPFACHNGQTEADAADKAETDANFACIDIKGRMNRQYNPLDEAVMIDGGRFFEQSEIQLYGIPFQVSTGGCNVIAPPPPPAENDDEIINFGVKTRRRLCRAVSRDGLTEIPVHAKATEFFFVLATTGKRRQRWGFSSDGTILGAYQGEVEMPLAVTDVEGFMVEIVYADQKRDKAFPLKLSAMRHVVGGDMDVYAVPADGTEVESIIFHNRHLENEFLLAAVTAHLGTKRLYPQMVIPSAAAPIVHKTAKDKKVCLAENTLTLQNGALGMTFETAHGLILQDMQNGYTPVFTAEKSSVLRVLHTSGTSEAMERIGQSADETHAVLTYRCGMLELTVTLSIEAEDCIGFNLTVRNTSSEAVRRAVCFPCLEGLGYQDAADGWYFVPKCQNLNSNETVFVYEESAPSFPMQFLDVYSAQQQGGLALTTEERELTVRKYALEKNETGISLYVEYPAMYGEIEAGSTFCCSPAKLMAHSGDWHAAFRLYKNWLDSWYEPYHCQNKEWYRRCFWLLAEIDDFFETKEMTRFPIWYDPETKTFNLKNILEEQKQLTGMYPDILHLWGWAYHEDKHTHQWGNYGEEDYAFYGGREPFKKALHEIQDDMGIRVSLYMHPTLLSARYPHAADFFQKNLRVQNDKGDFISILDDSYRMCHANSEWRAHAVSMYPRVYSELDVPLLYIDEFSLRIENRCYGKNHGHPVPSNLLQTDRTFITELKDAMPENVVLYGEYAAVDVNARYIDCNISYHIIDTVMDMVETAWRGGDGDDRYSRVITDMYRFAFPKIVQLVLPMAMRNLSWHPQKFTFFNGEAIYDSFWDLEESRGQAFMNHAYRLKKQYADCFASDEPETMVETLSPAICANRFPAADGRVVYTLYNRAYTTYRGAVLAVPHQEGQTYYDAWNEQTFSPQIADGKAYLALELDAQQMGCIAVQPKWN